MRFRPGFSSSSLLFVGFAACSGADLPRDAGTDAPSSDGDRACSFLPPTLSWSAPTSGVIVGQTRELSLRFSSPFCSGVTVQLSDESNRVEMPASVRIEVDQGSAKVRIVGKTPGETRLQATLRTVGPAGSAERVASILFNVAEDRLTEPGACSPVSRTLSPSSEVTLPFANVASAHIALHSGAARADEYHVEPFEVSLDCSDADLSVPGYSPIGPGVRFGPVTKRLGRDIELELPASVARVPAWGSRGDVRVAYSAPGISPRIVPVASIEFHGSSTNGSVRFFVPRLGTYRVVVPTAQPPQPTRRTYTGIAGFSMGGMGAALVGMKHLDVFDVIAPLGGPGADYRYLLQYMRRVQLGGFCTEAERAVNPTECAMGATNARAGKPTQLHEREQNFENWWYADGRIGQGGTFNRDDYLDLFRDLIHAFGNVNTNSSLDAQTTNFFPPGVPGNFATRTDASRCNNPIRIPAYDSAVANTGFFDDEYNPRGEYGAITFCDGSEAAGDVGRWDPNGTNPNPVDVALAIDVNGNGKRDLGEPVPRAMHERYLDVGLDGLASRDEAGFDSVTNPDPAGDDYDFQYNPGGTEGNWVRDGERCTRGAAGVAEPFDDFGLDGVASTRQLGVGGFDSGEGNDCFDGASGWLRATEQGAWRQLMNATPTALNNVSVFADGGIRDLFNSAVSAANLMGAFQARGVDLTLMNSHQALYLIGSSRVTLEPHTVPWEELGSRVMLRYGNTDATDNEIRDGDGGHVGSVLQLFDRINAATYFASSRWPNGDHRGTSFAILCGEAACANRNPVPLTIQGPRTRNQNKFSVMVPPGYNDAENANARYPVLFFLHGYGQSADDIAGLAAPLFTQMADETIIPSARLQKMIIVFPNGQCEPGECVRGTFYADAPQTRMNAAQNESLILDILDYVRANYRTKSQP